MITILAHDAGRYLSNEHWREYNDCVVRAIAIAYNYSYNHAYELCRDFGKREHNDGIIDANIAKVLKVIDRDLFRFTPKHSGKLITVERFVKEFPNGTYLLSLADHITVVEDGTLYDIDMAPKHLLTSEIEYVYKKSS